MTGNQTLGYIGIALALFLAPIAAIAQSGHSWNYSDDELALLPPYCQAKFGNDKAAKQLWAQRMGAKNWLHLHHHCSGLNSLNLARMEFSDQRRRNRLLGHASKEFDYVLARWPAEFPLVQEAQASKQEVEALRRH